jgi:hypothetical protein
MKLSSVICLFMMLFVCNMHVCAQDADTLIYRDTVYANEEAGDGQTAAAVEADSILVQNGLSLSADSIRHIKKEKELAWAQNLDSLLEQWQRSQLQKEQEAKPDSMQGSWLIRFFSSDITIFFFWALAIASVCFILYRLFFEQGIFQRGATKLKTAEGANHEEDDNTINGKDYNKLVAGAAASGNYRLAVRYLYLQCLQHLDEKGHINFAVDKTNAQYARELYGKTYKNDFALLTRQYEYVWYGNAAVANTVFESIQNNFKQFYKQL